MDISTTIALAALLVSVIYHWVNRRDVLTRMEEWRINISDRITSLEADFKKSQFAVLENRISNCESLIEELRYHKHHVVDKYVPGKIDALEHRVQQAESRK